MAKRSRKRMEPEPEIVEITEGSVIFDFRPAKIYDRLDGRQMINISVPTATVKAITKHLAHSGIYRGNRSRLIRMIVDDALNNCWECGNNGS